MACLSAGKKSDLLSAVVCVCCWVRDVCVCRARLLFKVWVAATKATFLKTQLVIVLCLPGPWLLFLWSPTSEDCTSECVIRSSIVPLCTAAPLYVCLVMWREINDVLESLV